jgi:anti-anti-sigma factor
MTAIDLGGGFTITPQECEEYVCWEVTGELDVFRTPRLVEAIAAACVGGRRRHLVDLTGVASVDACAVRELIALHKLARSEGGLAVAAQPQSDVWSVLVATGADRILQLFTHRMEAGMALAGGRTTARRRSVRRRVMRHS